MFQLNEAERRSAFFASLAGHTKRKPIGLVGNSVSAKPEIEILKTYQSIDLEVWHALGEFVDNAVTSFWDRIIENPNDARFEKLTVTIDWDEGSEILKISDNAGGIPRTEDGWGRALKPGAANPDPYGLSVHGVGLKAAGLWWAPVIEIHSKYVDDDVEVRAVMNLDELIASGTDTVDLDLQPAVDPDGHFTTVKLLGLNQGRSYPVGKTTAKVRTYLASMYRAYLRGDDEFLHPGTGKKWLELVVKGQKLEYEDPPILTKPYWPNERGPGKDLTDVYWKKAYEIEVPIMRDESAGGGGHFIVRGWMGIMATMTRNRAGILLTYKGKGVSGVEQGGNSDGKAFKPHKIFGALQGQRAGRLVGEFDISAFGKSLTTDAVRWSPLEEEAFVSALYEAIRDESFPLYQMASNFRIAELNSTSEAEKKKVRDTFNQVSVEAEAINKHVGALPDNTQNSPSKPPQDSINVINSDEIFELHAGKKARVVGRFEPMDPWVTIYGEEILTIGVNLAHPFVYRFFDQPSKIRPILYFAIALASAEIDRPEIAQVRSHINKWLKEVGDRDLDVLRIDDEDE